jgi:hypothetical protein
LLEVTLWGDSSNNGTASGYGIIPKDALKEMKTTRYRLNSKAYAEDLRNWNAVWSVQPTFSLE